MHVDASYPEFVSGRWSMLYRLAVLLVGEAEAEDLTRAALLRAYVSWRRLAQESTLDDAARKVLVGTALARGRTRTETAGVAGTAHPAGSPADELWTRIGSLPARERAVLVLLYHEGLTEPEAARVLGWSTRTVRARAFDALTHLGSADVSLGDLRAELARRATEVEVPLAPVDALVPEGRQARRDRARRTLSWITAAVSGAVVVALLGSTVDGESSRDDRAVEETGSPSGRPATLANLPPGDPPDLAYAVDRTLHVAGREVTLAGRPSTITQAPGQVLVSYTGGRVDHVRVDTLEVHRLTSTAATPAVVDPSGELGAWLERGTGPATVVLHSLVDGTERRQAFPATPACCDNPFLVHGFTGRGELVASMPAADRVWAWDADDPTGTPGRIEGVGTSTVADVDVTEVVVHDPPFHFAAGDLAGDSLRVTHEIQARSAEFGDPRGRRVVYVDRDGETVVRDRAQRRRDRRPRALVPLQVPILDAGFTGAWWEDADHVLLDVADDVVPRGMLVRCQVETGACEVAARFDGPHVVAR